MKTLKLKYEDLESKDQITELLVAHHRKEGFVYDPPVTDDMKGTVDEIWKYIAVDLAEKEIEKSLVRAKFKKIGEDNDKISELIMNLLELSPQIKSFNYVLRLEGGAKPERLIKK